MDEPKPTGSGARHIRIVGLAAAVIVAGVAVAYVAVYGIGGQKGNAETASCSASQSVASAAGPLAIGEIAALIIGEQPSAAPNLTFVDDSGAARKLSDWKGKAVLFNLWATWCAPCRHEMPALDNLQAELGGDDFEVVAVNIDKGDDAKPKRFLEEVGVDDLAYYADHTTDVFRELKKAGKAFGLPTTLLIDRDGCEIGHMAGPAQWDSDDAKALIRAVIGKG